VGPGTCSGSGIVARSGARLAPAPDPAPENGLPKDRVGNLPAMMRLSWDLIAKKFPRRTGLNGGPGSRSGGVLSIFYHKASMNRDVIRPRRILPKSQGLVGCGCLPLEVRLGTGVDGPVEVRPVPEVEGFRTRGLAQCSVPLCEPRRAQRSVRPGACGGPGIVARSGGAGRAGS